MKITGTSKRATLTIDGVKAAVSISCGPWVEGVNPAMIKVKAKKGLFPNSFGAWLEITNNSDGRTDYFESDSLRLLPGHPLYEMAKAVAAK